MPNLLLYEIFGEIVESSGATLRAALPGAANGCLVRIYSSTGPVLAKVRGFRNGVASLMPLEESSGIGPKDRVELLHSRLSVEVGSSMLGGAIDPLGKSLGPNLNPLLTSRIQLDVPAKPVSERRETNERLVTGIRAIDAFVPIARGQRLLIAAEAGVGKTSLLKMLAEGTDADVVVLALIGERGREAAEFLSNGLAPETKSKTVAVISTSEESPARRQLCGQTATRVAEYFADLGSNVLLLFDSLTRYTRAVRDTALAAGDPPVRRGYPVAVYSDLPRMLERAGCFRKGSITAFYSMLLTSDVDEDPMIEEVRGILDGHITLRRGIAESGIYPALSIPESLSRLEGRLTDNDQKSSTAVIRRLMSRLASDRNLALFADRLDPELAVALELEPDLRNFLSQTTPELLESTLGSLAELAERATEAYSKVKQLS